MGKHDKKCEVILWIDNPWNACWCHERELESETTRLTREVVALKDTAANYLDEIDRLNKVGGSDIDPECDSCAMLRELLREARSLIEQHVERSGHGLLTSIDLALEGDKHE
jgi:hypothetical protein